MKKTNRFLIIFIVIVLTLSAIIGAVAYAASLMPKKAKEAQSPTNPDDAINHIKTSDNTIGGKEYSFTISSTTPVIPKGTIRTYDGYMYVYGYYYTGSETSGSISTSSLSSWTAMSETDPDYGWGCAAISKTATSYSNPKGILGYYDESHGYVSGGTENMGNESVAGEPVTYFNRAYANCKKMTNVPTVPTTAKHTDEIFLNCEGLTKIAISGMNHLGKNAFKGCQNLRLIYLGKQVATIGGTGTNSPFYQSCATLSVYFEGNVPSWASGWNNGIAQYVTNWDYAMYDPDLLCKYEVRYYTGNGTTGSTYTLYEVQTVFVNFPTTYPGSQIVISGLKKIITGCSFEGGKAGNAPAATRPSSFDTSTTILANGMRVINMYYKVD